MNVNGIFSHFHLCKGRMLFGVQAVWGSSLNSSRKIIFSSQFLQHNPIVLFSDTFVAGLLPGTSLH
jgi:hypothetical protein